MEIVRQKNVATYIVFPIVDADGDFVSGAAGLDSELSYGDDGNAFGSFADCTNEATEIGSSGLYYLSLAQSEMNHDYIVIQTKTSTTGAKTQTILIRTMIGDPLNVGTHTSGRELAVDSNGRGDISLIEGSDATDQINTACDTAISDAGVTTERMGALTDWIDGGRLDLLIDSILADTNELQTDITNGGRIDLLIDAILADTNEIQVELADGGRTDLLIDAILADTNELQTDWHDGGRLDLLLDTAQNVGTIKVWNGTGWE